MNFAFFSLSDSVCESTVHGHSIDNGGNDRANSNSKTNVNIKQSEEDVKTFSGA